MTMTPSEIEATRRRLRIWRDAQPLLEEQRWRELRALTDEQALKLTRALLARQAVPPRSAQTSGLVEQQVLLQRSRER